jgi:hypothetical protein
MKKITTKVEDGFYQVESYGIVCQSPDGDYLEFVMDEYYRKVYLDGHLGCTLNDGRIYHFLPSGDDVQVKMRFCNDNQFRYHYKINKKELLSLPYYDESDGRKFNPFEIVYFYNGNYVYKIDFVNKKIVLSEKGNLIDKIAFFDNNCKYKETLDYLKCFFRQFDIII